MPIEPTPTLLARGTDQEYIDRLRLEYMDKKIVIPEGRTVIFFLKNDKDCLHFLCGKNSSKINSTRAHYMLFIRYILENSSIRQIKRHLETGNIVFFCEELLMVVICTEMTRGDWRCFTYHPIASDQKAKFSDPNKYVDFAFN